MQSVSGASLTHEWHRRFPPLRVRLHLQATLLRRVCSRCSIRGSRRHSRQFSPLPCSHLRINHHKGSFCFLILRKQSEDYFTFLPHVWLHRHCPNIVLTRSKSDSCAALHFDILTSKKLKPTSSFPCCLGPIPRPWNRGAARAPGRR